jgi:hypothetical protein
MDVTPYACTSRLRLSIVHLASETHCSDSLELGQSWAPPVYRAPRAAKRHASTMASLRHTIRDVHTAHCTLAHSHTCTLHTAHCTLQASGAWNQTTGAGLSCRRRQRGRRGARLSLARRVPQPAHGMLTCFIGHSSRSDENFEAAPSHKCGIGRSPRRAHIFLRYKISEKFV